MSSLIKWQPDSEPLLHPLFVISRTSREHCKSGCISKKMDQDADAERQALPKQAIKFSRKKHNGQSIILNSF